MKTIAEIFWLLKYRYLWTKITQNLQLEDSKSLGHTGWILINHNHSLNLLKTIFLQKNLFMLIIFLEKSIKFGVIS